MFRAPGTSVGTHRSGLTLIALFAVVWLNMALQPCLMAAEPLLPEQTDHECPHCPQPATHCDDSVTRCGFIGDLDYDGRSPEQTELPVLAAAPTFELRALSLEGAGTSRPIRSTLPRAGPRLHLRNCVYLN